MFLMWGLFNFYKWMGEIVRKGDFDKFVDIKDGLNFFWS